jgi:hypothetical protein
MATIKQIEFDIREALKEYRDDSELSSRYIIYLFNLKRSKYLRNDLNNFQKTIDISILQTLCLELEEVSISQCNLDIDCTTIMRTKQPLPKPLELHLKSAITTVKSSNKLDVPFNFITKEKAVYALSSPFNNAIYAFLDDDMHIYLISNMEEVKLIECISVTAVFENPLDLKDYKNCCKCEVASVCFDEGKTQYPIQSHHIDNIRTEIVQMLIKSLQIPEDKFNNSEDN